MAGNLSRSNDLGIGQGRFLKAATALCMFFLLAPLAVLVLYSFNASRQVTVWGGFSVSWFAETMKDRELWLAIRNSLIIAGVNALLSTALGAMAALAIGRFAFRGRRLLSGFLYIPVILPEIILGIALLILFVLLDIPRGFLTVILGHVTFSFPFVALLVLARVQALDRAQEEASLDLGATAWQTFRHVILPPLAPALLSGALFAFTMSLDDFVVTFFTTGPAVTTLPMKVYSMVKFGLTPAINVISTLLIAFTLLALLAVNWLQQGGPRQRWGMRLGGGLAVLLAVLSVVSLVGERKQKNLVLAIWSNYLAPELLEEFEAKTGIHVVLNYFNDNEELLAKTSFGRPGIDLVVPTGYVIEIMIKAGLIVPLDFDRLPNARFLDERFRRLPYDPSGRYYVPYAYGLTGLLYNSEKVPGPVDSWRILWDERYRGRILMFDDMLECFDLAHRLLGHQLAAANLAHLDEALALLQKQAPLLRKRESNLINEMLLGGEVDLAQNWNGGALRLMSEHPEFRFVVPKEGTVLFVDNLCLLKSAPNPEAAHQFLDFILDPRNASRNMESILYAMPIPEAQKLMSAELRDNTTMFPSLDDMAKFSVVSDLGPFLPEIQARWIRLKSQ